MSDISPAQRWAGTPFYAPVRQALTDRRAQILHQAARQILDRGLQAYVEEAHTLAERIWPDYAESELVTEAGEDPAEEPCDQECGSCNWCSSCGEYHGEPDLMACCGGCGSCDHHDSDYETDSEVCDMGHCHECEHHCGSL